MRVTNKMMTNSMLSNINSNKNLMAKLEEQYMSQKKIQRPSDDPIIAVRALKLRTNLSELEQYLDKNVPDARSWMEMTEGALRTVNGVLSKMNTLCVQGSSDPLTAKDRKAVMQDLIEMKEQIYQEGNANLAGRYVFTGYKTNSSLTFQENTTNLEYTISEEFKGEDIRSYSTVINSYDASGMPIADAEKKEIYRLNLSYKNIEDLSSINIDGADQAFNLVSLDDPNPYDIGDNQISVIKETGEIIMGKTAYKNIYQAKEIAISYEKTSFLKGELKPEHYFDCEVIDNTKNADDNKTIYTRDKEGQKIQYEVNFNQRLVINVEGYDAIMHSTARMVDDIEKAVGNVLKIEEKIDSIKEKLKDKTLTDAEKEENEQILERLEDELMLTTAVMREAFERGISAIHKEQDVLNTATSDIGSRMVRLNLTESRLMDQKDEFTELLSNNEDVNLVDVLIKFGSAQNVYMASLSATAKSMKNSLLDFL